MSERQQLALRDPSIYNIHIQGILDESWGDYFGGKVVTDADGVVTTLCTPLMDQAALVGLVNRLNGMGLRLLAVEQMPIGKNCNKETTK